MRLTLALSYGGRNELVRAVRAIALKVGRGELAPEALDATEIERHLDTRDTPPPDLIIRTGGEQRLSNFLLWQAAYAELYFTPVQWPDFGAGDLDTALAWYHRSQRRFGMI
jgi:undecaprenyl diphosphate synthase